MKKAKYWLFSIAMVAFVSLVLGPPVMAHGDKSSKRWHGNNSHNSKKWDHKFHKKMKRDIAKQVRKIYKYEKKIEKASNRKNSKRWMKRLDRKHAWNKRKHAWLEEKLARHNEKYHAAASVEEAPEPVVAEAPAPVVVEPTVVEPPPECAEGTTGTYPDCVPEVEEELVCPPGTVGTFPFCAQA